MNYHLLVLCSVILGIGGISCSKNDDPNGGSNGESNPEDVLPITKTIPGKWLLGTSGPIEWTTYDFQSSGFVTAQWSTMGSQTGTGMYFTNDEDATLTAAIDLGNENYKYIDWVITSVQACQMDIEIYGNDGNQLIQTTSIHKILSEKELEKGKVDTPDYRGMCGSNNYSEFRSLNPEIVSVNDESGELTALNYGKTFIGFKTPHGYAAVSVNVVEKNRPLSENILGTWVTDVIGYVWERDVFGPDGYFFANWSREVIYPTDNESAQGKYTVDDAANVIKVSSKTPYNQILNVDYHIMEMDRFSFYTHIYSGGDKTGEFYYQRMIESKELKVDETFLPEYLKLTDNIAVNGYKSHNEAIATVDDHGTITAVSPGMTYIDVKTDQGAAVIEISVK